MTPGHRGARWRRATRSSLTCLVCVAAILVTAACDGAGEAPERAVATSWPLTDMLASTPLEDLGRALYFDVTLSRDGNQSCATCHDAAFGFSGPDSAVNAAGAVYAGSVRERFGNRRPPSASYATFAPILHFDDAEGLWIGGNFWDGRATGEVLGTPAADQAIEPLLNPVQQALPDRACVIYRVREGPYSELWLGTWGDEIADVSFPESMDQECRRDADDFGLTFSLQDQDILDRAFGQVGLSIAAFEASPDVNAFSSRYDAWKAGADVFTEQEEWGFELFTGDRALCSECHIADLSDPQDLFTDFTFDNLGVPINPQSPVYESDPAFVDLGLGGFLGDPAEHGKQKVPSLRNVDKRPSAPATKAFTHNGYFKSLEQVVHFYNTRDAKPACPGPYTSDEAMAEGCWPVAEVMANVNTDELGDLGLTAEEEAAIVAFMRTLSDE